MKKIAFVAAALLIAAASLLTAQSMKKGFEWVTKQSDDPLLPGVNPLKVTGNVISAGSSTVYPLSERMVERFTDEGHKGNITVDSIGSGAGFERFCVAGETDIANASRAIKSSEVESARKIGREPLEFRIGTDSGTFDYFVEDIFGKKKEPILGAANLQLSEDDNVLVQGVEGSPYAVGFFGYAYFQENKDKLKVLSINAVAPSAETVNKGTYPLARPLFLYSTAKIMREKPQVAALLAFYLTYVNQEIRSVGYFPADAEGLNKAKQNWLDAMKGAY